MKCPNAKDFPCTKINCANHGKCCDCIIKHKNMDSLPYCLFIENNGDKRTKHHFNKIKNNIGRD